MTAILRIEDQQGAQRPINILDGEFCLDAGSRTQSVLPNGNVQDTMTLFIKRRAAGIRGNVKRLTAMLTNDAGVVLGATNPAYLVEATDGEPPRRSLIVNATIQPIEHSIVSSDLRAGAALYALTIERQAFYEAPTKISKTWDAVIGADNSGTDYLIPKRLEDGDVLGRIDTLIVQPKNAARIKSLWMGMKPRYGVADDDLSTWSPLVKIGSASANLGSNSTLWTSADSDYYADWIGGQCVRVDFGSYSHWSDLDDKWATRASIPLSRWNGSFEGGKEWQYVGRYRAVLRWASKVPGASGIENETNTRYGVRLWTAYSADAEPDKLAPVYPRPAYDGQWNWLELGEITIGGDGWSYADQLREKLTNFTIGLDVALLGDDAIASDDDALPAFFIGGIYLVPAEHYLHTTVKNEFGADKRLDIYTHSDGTVRAYVSGSDSFFDELFDRNEYAMPIYERVSEIEAVNFGTPHRGGRWVIIADRREQNTQAKGARATVTMHAVPRMRLFGG